MNRRLQFTTISVFLLSLAACYDLIEVVPTDTTEPRWTRIDVNADTRWNGPAEFSILFDPGTTANGLSKILPDDSIVIADVKYAPDKIYEGGYRAYAVTGIDFPEGPVTVLLPLVAGLNERPVLTLPLIRIDAPDTLIAHRGGSFEVGLIGGRTTDDPNASWWFARLQTVSRQDVVTLSAPGIPVALRIPTQVLPSHVTNGFLQAAITSSYVETGLPYVTGVDLRFFGDLPFRVLDQ
jgi:hypothetical protein